jgi:type IV/VI secretion system ImpK/VasF family protein
MDSARQESGGNTAERATRPKRETLANLYQGFLTGIVRLMARRQKLGDPEAFRSRMKSALKEIRREATGIGYPPEDIDDAEFAVVAFLDEVILNSDDPSRPLWEKKTLGVEMFGEAAAGELFYDRIESYRKRNDSHGLAALLEIYLLCLLLGFQGRYAGSKGEIHAISDRLRRRVDSIRQTDPRLTPQALPKLNRDPAPLHSASSAPWRRLAIGAAAGAAALFVLLKVNLWWAARTLESAIRN